MNILYFEVLFEVFHETMKASSNFFTIYVRELIQGCQDQRIYAIVEEQDVSFSIGGANPVSTR